MHAYKLDNTTKACVHNSITYYASMPAKLDQSSVHAKL